MIRRDDRCVACGWHGERIAASGVHPPCPVCGGETETVWMTPPTVQDDTLPGGARWVENLDHHPVWIETKTEMQAALEARGLRIADKATAVKADQSPWASPAHLKPGWQDDRHVRQITAEATTTPGTIQPTPPAPALQSDRVVSLQPSERRLIEETDAWCRAHGIQLVLDCRLCRLDGLGRIVAHDTRGAASWGFGCAHRQYQVPGGEGMLTVTPLAEEALAYHGAMLVSACGDWIDHQNIELRLLCETCLRAGETSPYLSSTLGPDGALTLSCAHRRLVYRGPDPRTFGA